MNEKDWQTRQECLVKAIEFRLKRNMGTDFWTNLIIAGGPDFASILHTIWEDHSWGNATYEFDYYIMLVAACISKRTTICEAINIKSSPTIEQIEQIEQMLIEYRALVNDGKEFLFKLGYHVTNNLHIITNTGDVKEVII